MTDIALVWDPIRLVADLSVFNNDISTEEGLRTAVVLSLFLDRRVGADEVPEGETDPRGWWGDSATDRIGSRLWLLDRATNTPATLDRARVYALEALQWLVDDSVAESVDVTTEFVRSPSGGWGLGLFVTIRRPATDPVSYQFGRVWDAETART